MKDLVKYLNESLLDDLDELEKKSDEIIKNYNKLIGHYEVTGTYISGVTYLNKYLDKNAIKKLGIKAKPDIFKVYRSGKRDNSSLSHCISMLVEYIMYNLDIEEFNNALNHNKSHQHYQYQYITINDYIPKMYTKLVKLFQKQDCAISLWQDKNLRINFWGGNYIAIELEKK